MFSKDWFESFEAGTPVGSAASKWGMGGGTVTTALGWLSSSGATVLIGLLITLVGFLVNFFSQKRREKREIEERAFREKIALREESRKEELHRAKLKALQDNCQV